MSTRSNIIVQTAAGSWARIYCHFDGYLEGVGAVLQEHYDNEARALALIALGDLSALYASPDKPPGHSFNTPTKGYCVAYGRDRGETGTEADVFATFAEAWPPADSWGEYVYVFGALPGGPNSPAWYVGDPDMGPASLVLLALALKDPGNFAPQPDVKSPWGVLWHRDETRAA